MIDSIAGNLLLFAGFTTTWGQLGRGDTMEVRISLQYWQTLKYQIASNTKEKFEENINIFIQMTLKTPLLTLSARNPYHVTTSSRREKFESWEKKWCFPWGLPLILAFHLNSTTIRIYSTFWKFYHGLPVNPANWVVALAQKSLIVGANNCS